MTSVLQRHFVFWGYIMMFEPNKGPPMKPMQMLPSCFVCTLLVWCLLVVYTRLSSIMPAKEWYGFVFLYTSFLPLKISTTFSYWKSKLCFQWPKLWKGINHTGEWLSYTSLAPLFSGIARTLCREEANINNKLSTHLRNSQKMRVPSFLCQIGEDNKISIQMSRRERVLLLLWLQEIWNSLQTNPEPQNLNIFKREETKKGINKPLFLPFIP
jgi:hypothetical protein